MPPKIRDLINKLEQAGFRNRGGKGSHRVFIHARVAKPVVISGQSSDDALNYQEKAVEAAIKELKR